MTLFRCYQCSARYAVQANPVIYTIFVQGPGAQTLSLCMSSNSNSLYNLSICNVDVQSTHTIPWCLTPLRTRLCSLGKLHRQYNVYVPGKWQPVRDSDTLLALNVGALSHLGIRFRLLGAVSTVHICWISPQLMTEGRNSLSRRLNPLTTASIIAAPSAKLTKSRISLGPERWRL